MKECWVGGISLSSRLPGIYFQLDYRAPAMQDKITAAPHLVNNITLSPSCTYRRPFSSAIEPRQCEQWSRQTGVTHTRRLISSSIKEPMFYKQLCATRPLPVKTFRTAATDDAVAPMCRDDGVSHVPPFVFLGHWEIAKCSECSFWEYRSTENRSWRACFVSLRKMLGK